MPPTRSASFSRRAIHAAAELDAPFSDSANTDEPRASGLIQASAWIDTNRSACTARAFATRVRSGTKKSPSRVIATRMFPWSATIMSRRRRPMASVTFFS
jgi:hypothetical protein